jgi:hypothetical protein
MQDIVPTSTVTDYLNNVNNVQDPSTWNWNPSGNTETIRESDVDAFNAAGIDVFSIIAVTPSWLGITTNYGSMPSNWTVFQDIVKKIYAHYHNKVKYFEIFNEPEIELDLTGSSYSSVEAAYLDLYKHSIDAIKTVNSNPTDVGGPTVAYTSNTNYLNDILSSSGYNDMGFASWHNYGNSSTYDTGIYNWKSVASSNGRPELPMYVTEYNTGAGDSANTDEISWTAGRMSVLMDAGAAGAYVYGTDDRASGYNSSVRHDWYVIDQSGSLTPRMSTFRLLSKDLSLGTGTNQMKLTTSNGLTWASAALNSNGNPVVWAVNDSTSSVTTSVELDNTALTGPTTLTHYVASPSNDASSAALTETKTAIDGRLTTSITVPAKSVYGIIVGSTTTPALTESVWGSLTPASTWSNNTSWELGTRFSPNVNGVVSAVKVYATTAESGNHTARIWNNATGTVVGGPYTINYGGTAGWISYSLPAAVALTAGTEYTITVSTGTDTAGTLPFTSTGATTAGSNGNHLNYPANAGVASNTMGARPTTSSGNNYLRDVVFIPTGNTNLAAGKTATASSSYSSSFAASTAVDGKYFADDLGNAWASGTSVTNSWWQVDLGTSGPIHDAKIQFRGYPNTSSQLVFQQVPTSITFQVSNDNVNWATVVSKSSNVPTVGTRYSQQKYDYTLNSSGRYLRLLFEDGSQGGTYAVLNELTEVEVYGH